TEGYRHSMSPTPLCHSLARTFHLQFGRRASLRGYIILGSDANRVEFGFGVPLPEADGQTVVFDVKRIAQWGQRNEPRPSAVIGRKGEVWSEVLHGSEETGIYLGGQLALVAGLPVSLPSARGGSSTGEQMSPWQPPCQTGRQSGLSCSWFES